MSHETFHVHGAAEVRVTVLQNRDLAQIALENPLKSGEKDADYQARITALAPKRVDFQIFESEEFLPGSMQALFDQAENGGKYELIFTGNKLIKTFNQLQSENPKKEDEKPEDYKARIQKLFDAQVS